MISIKSIVAVILFSLALIAGLIYVFEQGSEPASLESGDAFDGPFRTLEGDNETSMNEENTNGPVYADIVTNKGTIRLELFTEQMPITTENFITLARDGFYDGTKFHRVIEGFMIQGGDPNSKSDDTTRYGQGGPEYTIADEFVDDPKLTNVRGTIAMANTGQPNSGGSQFFINLGDNIGLDYDKEPRTSRHPVFGTVVSGMDVVDAIAAVETGERDIPTEPVIVETVTIDG